MKKSGRLNLLLALVSVFAAITAISVAFALFFEKKRKDEEELEHYLDCSIQ